MAFIIIGLIVIIVVKALEESRRKKIEAKHKAHYAADYLSYVENYDKAFFHPEDHCYTFDEWMEDHHYYEYREYTQYFNQTTDIIKFASILAVIIGVATLIISNITNAMNYRCASDYVTVYQSYIDNASDEFVSAGTGDSIIDFNEAVIDHRYYQNNWYFSSHYLWSGDWDTIPLVEWRAADD